VTAAEKKTSSGEEHGESREHVPESNLKQKGMTLSTKRTNKQTVEHNHDKERSSKKRSSYLRESGPPQLHCTSNTTATTRIELQGLGGVVGGGTTGTRHRNNKKERSLKRGSSYLRGESGSTQIGRATQAIRRISNVHMFFSILVLSKLCYHCVSLQLYGPLVAATKSSLSG
jgi:hypothetical protein